MNPGGNSPPPKQVTFGGIQGTTSTFNSGKNGQVSGTVTLTAPTITASQAGCPNPNWTVQILHITYDNVVLHVTAPDATLTYSFGTVDP